MVNNDLLDQLLLDKIELGIFPTPIKKMVNSENFCKYRPLYIKRDDLTGLGPGGNKVRSLEYIFAQAIKQNADVIIASGPLQSNLCTLVACASAKAQLPCILVHNSENPEKLEGNILLNKLIGVESHYIGNVTEYDRNDYVEELYNKLRENGRNPYIVRAGGSTGYGALGYINAIKEMSIQCKENNLDISEIFAPGGNGGVAAGLIYGNAIFGFPFKINIISVEYDKETLSNNILQIFDELTEITNIPFDYNIDDVCNIIDDYMGEGWGKNTKESSQIVYDFPKTEGIFIENIYTSKVLVGMFDMIKKSKVSGGICYIHTGGFSSLFSQF